MKIGIFSLLVALFPTLSVFAEEEFEKPPILKSSDFLSEKWITGPLHQLDEKVNTERFFNLYSIKTGSGTTNVYGTRNLYQYIRELYATEALKKIKAPKAVVSGAAGQAIEDTTSALKIVTHPFRSIDNIGKGARSFLTSRKTKVTGNYESNSKIIGKVLKVDKRRLTVASQVGVDPYSFNPELQKELKRLSVLKSLGTLGFGQVRSGLKLDFPGESLVSSLSKDGGGEYPDKFTTSPKELFASNLELMIQSGASTQVRDALLENTYYTPAEQTFLVRQISGLVRTTQGADELYALSSSAQSRDDAYFYRGTVELLEIQNQQRSRLKRIFIIKSIPVCLTDDGMLVIPLHVDHVSWVPELELFFSGLVESPPIGKDEFSQISIITSGLFTDRARDRCDDYSIELIENALRVF